VEEIRKESEMKKAFKKW